MERRTPDPASSRESNSRQDAENVEITQEKDSGNALLALGTAFVIGAVAANVIGFRYSRWAVGKEIHRGWERYDAASRARTQKRQAESSARQKTGEPGARASGSEFRSSGAKSAQSDDFSDVFNEFRRHAEQFERMQRRAAAEQASRARRAQEATRQRRDREARDSARQAYESWERTWGSNGQRNTRFTGFRVDLDNESLADLLRQMQRGSRQSRGGFGGIGIDPNMLEELLRAAQSAGQRSNRRSGSSPGAGFPGDDFWEQVLRDAERAAGGSGRSGFGTGGPHGFSNNASAFGGGRSAALSTLGLQPGASDSEIKAAYRKEAMKWHPDRYAGANPDEAAKRFREVTAAYETLKKR